MKIRSKLTLAGIIVSGVSLAIVTVVAIVLMERGTEFAQEEVTHLAHDNNQRIVAGVVAMVTSQQEVLEQKVEADLAVARHILSQAGGFRATDETLTWNAVNQFTGDSSAVELPQIVIGDQPIEQNRSFRDRMPVVDLTQDLVGGTATIFQRMNPAGDMLRIATNVETLSGERAIGTYIPARNPDGTQNAVVSTVLRGERFVGRAFVVNAWYVTAYEPIRDERGSVVGILYTGVREDSAASLRAQILETEVGETGYVFVLDSSGQYIISQDGERDGETIIDAQDSDGRYFIRELVEQAIALEPGEYGELSYPWQNPGDPEPRVKTVNFAYFEPWDWIIAAGTYDEEFLAGVHAIEAQNRRGQALMFALIAAALGSAVVVWIVLATRIARPISRGAEFAKRIARGELAIDLDIHQSDEVGILADAMREMLRELKYKADALAQIAEGDLTTDVQLASDDDGLGESLRSMVKSLDSVLTQVRDAAQQVGAGADQIASSSQSLSQGATESASSIEEITASVNEINGQVTQTAESVEEAVKISTQAADDARTGRDRMGELREAMDSISASSETTRQVVKVIDDIAFQINLLALNANVEAARAGKYGKGFAVVAEEVRNLAARSADAVKETAAMVEQSVASIETGNRISRETAEQLEGIAEGAGRVAAVLTEIAAATREQRLGIEQIGEGLEQVDQVTQANTAEAEESAAASEQLSGQAAELNRVVAMFKLDTGRHGSIEAPQQAAAQIEGRSEHIGSFQE